MKKGEMDLISLIGTVVLVILGVLIFTIFKDTLFKEVIPVIVGILFLVGVILMLIKNPDLFTDPVSGSFIFLMILIGLGFVTFPIWKETFMLSIYRPNQNGGFNIITDNDKINLQAGDQLDVDLQLFFSSGSWDKVWVIQETYYFLDDKLIGQAGNNTVLYTSRSSREWPILELPLEINTLGLTPGEHTVWIYTIAAAPDDANIGPSDYESTFNIVKETIRLTPGLSPAKLEQIVPTQGNVVSIAATDDTKFMIWKERSFLGEMWYRISRFFSGLGRR